jgi:hypothetical protein
MGQNLPERGRKTEKNKEMALWFNIIIFFTIKVQIVYAKKLQFMAQDFLPSLRIYFCTFQLQSIKFSVIPQF